MFKSVIVLQNGSNVTQTFLYPQPLVLSFYINIELTLSIGHNWKPSLSLKNCHCRLRYFHQFLIFPKLRINYFEVTMVKLSTRGAGFWKCLISAFHHFLHPQFQNDQGWPIIPNVSLLTWYIVINRYVRLQNYLLVMACLKEYLFFGHSWLCITNNPCNRN